MIRYLFICIFIISTLASAEEAPWILITPGYKQVKVNGSALKKSVFWELPQFHKLDTGDAEALIFLSEKYFLKVYKNTQIRHTDSVLQLISGRIYIKTQASGLEFQVPSFFKFSILPGDFAVEFDPNTKQTTFEILSKSQTLQIDSDDRELTTSEGTKLSFQAEIVDGDIAYDFLLNDRKIPKLKMEKSKIEKPIVMDLTHWTNAVKKAAAEKKKVSKKEVADNSKYICKTPKGILNSCFFVQEAQTCVRYICNLSGDWTQKTIFSRNALCPKLKTVKDCEWITK